MTPFPLDRRHSNASLAEEQGKHSGNVTSRPSCPAEAAKPRLSRRRARHTEKTRGFKSGRANPRRMCVEWCHLTRMIATKEGRVRRWMSDSWKRAIFCGLAGLLAGAGLKITAPVHQPSAR